MTELMSANPCKNPQKPLLLRVSSVEIAHESCFLFRLSVPTMGVGRTEQLTKGCKPTLGEIQEGCNVSKHTAIKYRRALLGDDESEEAINQ
jgi:hypothetical protein